MLHWFEYLESRSEDGLVSYGEPGGWCLGDWNTTQEILLPIPFVNTYFYIKALRTAAEIAEILGLPEEKKRLEETAEQKKEILSAITTARRKIPSAAVFRPQTPTPRISVWQTPGCSML